MVAVGVVVAVSDRVPEVAQPDAGLSRPKTRVVAPVAKVATFRPRPGVDDAGGVEVGLAFAVVVAEEGAALSPVTGPVPAHTPVQVVATETARAHRPARVGVAALARVLKTARLGLRGGETCPRPAATATNAVDLPETDVLAAAGGPVGDVVCLRVEEPDAAAPRDGVLVRPPLAVETALEEADETPTPGLDRTVVASDVHTGDGVAFYDGVDATVVAAPLHVAEVLGRLAGLVVGRGGVLARRRVRVGLERGRPRPDRRVHDVQGVRPETASDPVPLRASEAGRVSPRRAVRGEGGLPGRVDIGVPRHLPDLVPRYGHHSRPAPVQTRLH